MLIFYVCAGNKLGILLNDLIVAGITGKGEKQV